jgi:hypothetical protein
LEVETFHQNKVSWHDFRIQSNNSMCYGKQKMLSLQQQVPKAQVWTIVEVVTMCLNPMVSACVLNQSESLVVV